MFLILLFLASHVFAVQTITNLTTNSPVPVGNKFVVTGDYNNSDTNAQVYCKFEVLDGNTFVMDRFSDELTFPDGTFYSEKVLNEPLYWRDTFYTMRVSCNTFVQDVNFFVGQREAVDNYLWGELFFYKDNGFMVIVVGITLIVAVFVIALFIRLLRHGWGSGHG